MTGRLWIFLELPNEISGLRELTGRAAHSDSGEARSGNVIGASVRAHVGVDDVRCLLWRQASKRNGLDTQGGAMVLVSVIHHRDERSRSGDPDRRHERRTSEHHYKLTDAPAPGQTSCRLRHTDRTAERRKIVENRGSSVLSVPEQGRQL